MRTRLSSATTACLLGLWTARKVRKTLSACMLQCLRIPAVRSCRCSGWLPRRASRSLRCHRLGHEKCLDWKRWRYCCVRVRCLPILILDITFLGCLTKKCMVFAAPRLPSLWTCRGQTLLAVGLEVRDSWPSASRRLLHNIGGMEVGSMAAKSCVWSCWLDL